MNFIYEDKKLDNGVGIGKINKGIWVEPSKPNLFLYNNGRLPDQSRKEINFSAEKYRSERFVLGYPNAKLIPGNKTGPNGIINPLSFIVPRSGIIPTLVGRFDPNLVTDLNATNPIIFANANLPNPYESQSEAYSNAMDQSTQTNGGSLDRASQK